MNDFWIFILIFSTMYPVQRDRLWVSAQSLTNPAVSQPDEELSVDIGDSATLRCCISENVVGVIAWFKQLHREKPQIIVTVYKSAGEKFYNQSQKLRFQIERASNCFNMTILNIIHSDEAMYYCALTKPNLVFADGTYLKIKGDRVSSVSETSNPARCDHSAVCDPTRHGNSTNMNTQENTETSPSLHWTVLGLGAALGLSVLLIFCLIYFILRRKTWNKWNTSVEDSPGARQESGAETIVNYAALKFPKRKAKADKRKTGSAYECVYSDVNKTVRRTISDS